MRCAGRIVGLFATVCLFLFVRAEPVAKNRDPQAAAVLYQVSERSKSLVRITKSLFGNAKQILARGRIESCMDCHVEYKKSDVVSSAYIKD